ncbi:claudin-10-like [Polymixia lowei]
MWRRLAQILGLLVFILGWGVVACTLVLDHWRVAQQGGQGGASVVTVAWYWSNLWKDCYEDSTAVVNCVDFGVLWVVKSYVQGVRGLLMTGLALGSVGTVLACFGMECTYVGGTQRTKDKMLMVSSAFHFLGCVSDMAGYCLYINRVAAAFLHAKADPSKLSYDIGTALYLGLAGCCLILLGCVLHCVTACRGTHPQRMQHSHYSGNPMVPFIRDEDLSVYQGKTSLHGHSSLSVRWTDSNAFPLSKTTSSNVVIV